MCDKSTKMLAVSTCSIGTAAYCCIIFGKPAYPLITIAVYFFREFLKSVREEGFDNFPPLTTPPPILFSRISYELLDIHVQPVLNGNRFSNPRTP